MSYVFLLVFTVDCENFLITLKYIFEARVVKCLNLQSYVGLVYTNYCNKYV